MPTATAGLTRDDIAALRKAKTVSFVLSPNTSHIMCSFHDAYGTEKARRQINIEHELVTYDCEKGVSKPLSEVACGYYYLGCADSHERWQTIAKLLRAGDLISLIWLRSAMTTSVMREHGLFGDRLDLVVLRQGNKPYSPLRKMRFTLATQCCENNTARMIRRGMYNTE